MDEVVASLHPEWILRYNKKYNDHMTAEDITCWEIDTLVKPECGKKIFELLTPDMYDTILPVPGAKEAVDAIRAAGAEVVFVTSCYTEEIFHAKVDWLVRHWFLDAADAWQQVFGIGPWSQSKHKSAVNGLDWLIDDYAGNLEGFKGYPILVTRPHNRNEISSHKRVKHLRDVVPLVEATVQEQGPGEFFEKVLEAAKPAFTMFDEVAPWTDKDFAKLSLKPGWETDLNKGGVKYDTGKPRMDLLPPHALRELAKLYGIGAQKYDDYNYMKGMSFSRVYAALQRHANAWFEGQDNDPETGLSHLTSVAWCAFSLLQFQEYGIGNDDRFWKGLRLREEGSSEKDVPVVL